MSKRKRQNGPLASSSDTVELKLTQNDFVGGVLYPKDTVFPFTRAEAERRMRTQKFWQFA